MTAHQSPKVKPAGTISTGKAAADFRIYYRACLLSYVAGEDIRADASLRAAMDASGVPVAWKE